MGWSSSGTAAGIGRVASTKSSCPPGSPTCLPGSGLNTEPDGLGRSRLPDGLGDTVQEGADEIAVEGGRIGSLTVASGTYAPDGLGAARKSSYTDRVCVSAHVRIPGI